MSENIFTAEIQQLRERQAAEAKAKAQRIEEIKARYQGIADERKAEQELREKEKEMAIMQQQQQQAEQAESELKASALAMWRKLGGGAQDGDFEAAWPSLRTTLLSVKMQTEAQRQAAGTAQYYRNIF